MKYVYAAMLLHKAGQKVDESSISKVLEAAGVKPDAAQSKSLAAALEGVDIDKAIKEASKMQVASAAPVAASGGGPSEEEKKAEAAKKEEDSKKGEQQAAAGLSALFG